MTQPIAVFFDIDGTLLHVNGAGRRAFSNAIATVFGWQDTIEYIQFAGATDLDVLHRIAQVQGDTLTHEGIQHFFRQLPLELADTARVSDATLFPGVRELIERLADHPAVHLGLITGNEEYSARIKLALFGLDHHFQFGAYGHEHGDRIEIAQLANRRLHERLPPGTRPQRYLLGDTPSDIAAARAIDAMAIGVATGVFTGQALLEAGADLVLETLENTEEILAHLGFSKPA